MQHDDMNSQLDFNAGNRILGQIHLLCKEFQNKVKAAIDSTREKEYAQAKKEVAAAQREIDEKRTRELAMIAESQARPLTTLEKVRLQNLQRMQELDRKAENEFVNSSFSSLLDRSVNAEPVDKVDEVVDDLVRPFCENLLLEIDSIYQSNQILLNSHTKSQETISQQEKRIKEMEKELTDLKLQASYDEQHIRKLKESVSQRNQSLTKIRDAYHKEVIAVKMNYLDSLNARTNVSPEELVNMSNRMFELELLNQPMKDAEGNDLDAFLEKINQRLTESGSEERERSSVAERDSKGGDEYEMQVKILKLENENIQMRLRYLLARYALETFRSNIPTLSQLKK
ncbi:hypothetical protein GUITHDRAFT_137555 [Guillardia theta CCMP2712]|uniref:Uncharacterized protein n=2 Tax=Guillardia theta TaxID=55529 RepID=L1JFW8_GUITC|nr:hypothetical protein GUITHDRAFT_137555 [Guillardia theta CCMP2712]EKX47381.1 hypothetical protein GUITHDRAFT_137555 [Guillardia theta CCMP2712]|eukprot:XP_005834361.1 hypothetical protein GUITHDRAFT_137555 [Guillardia theta CCMP2712]